MLVLVQYLYFILVAWSAILTQIGMIPTHSPTQYLIKHSKQKLITARAIK